MYAYNPRKKSYPQLEQSLVGEDRWDIINTLMKELTLKEGEKPKQHWIIVGPRGIGKSHLLTLLYYKIKTDKWLNQTWIPILLPEELRTATNLARFLERVLEEILREIQQSNGSIPVELKAQIEKARKTPAPERADNLFSVISWLHQQTGHFVLLIVENLQFLLGKRLPVIEQKKLRAFLQTSDALLIIGSTTTIFAALHDHSHPFYHFFHIRRLEDLIFEDMKILVTKILSHNGGRELSVKLKQNDARLRALYAFTGGNPRMAVFLADILRTDVPDEMLELMDRILDELTPYFLHIMEGVPDYLEEVINTLAALEPALSPKEIAEHLEVPQATIRNYLKQLKEDGYVRIAFSQGKSNYYSLNEYLYRIWFQMRDSSHRQETRWLLEFLLILYSRQTIIEEKEKITASFVRQLTPPYGDLGKGISVIDTLKHCRSSLNSPTKLKDLPMVYTTYFEPLLNQLDGTEYLKQFFAAEKDRRLSISQLSILLVLLDKYDIVEEHLPSILAKYRQESGEFELLIFAIKFNLWIKLIGQKLHKALNLVDLFIKYIISLDEEEKQESEVLNFFLGLLQLQVHLNINPEHVRDLLGRFKNEAGLSYDDQILKIWACLSDPDSTEARRYMSDKAVSELIKEIKNRGYTSPDACNSSDCAS